MIQVLEAAAPQASARGPSAQASNPAPAASTHGFTPVQLNVLRAQILAFRRIKVLLYIHECSIATSLPAQAYCCRGAGQLPSNVPGVEDN